MNSYYCIEKSIVMRQMLGRRTWLKKKTKEWP